MLKLIKISDDYLKYLVAAIILAVPLYPKFPLIRIPYTYVSIRLEDLLLAIAGVVVAVIFVPNLKRLLKGSIEKAIVVYLCLGFFSLVSGILLTNTIRPMIGFLHWARRIEYFVPFFLSLALFKEKKSELVEFVIKLIMVVVVIAFFYGLGQRYLHWPVIITQNEEYAKGIALRWIPGSHINSTFAGHYDLATYLVLVLPIFISLLAVVKGIKTKISLLFVLSCGFWLLSAAVSRISIVSFVLASSISLVLLKKYKATIILFLASFIVFGLSPDLRARYTRLFDVLKIKIQGQTRFLSDKFCLTVYAANENEIKYTVTKFESPTPTPQSVFEDRSTSIRFNVEWPRAVRAFVKNPFWGTGYSSITLATDNDYLRLLGEVGLFGFSAFMLIIFEILYVAKKSICLISRMTPVESCFLAAFIGGFVGVLLNAVFIDVFEASKLAISLWLLAGTAVSIHRNYSNE